MDKLHCLNHSGSSATYSDYSPSQGSSGSSNPPANTHSHTHSHTHQHAPALQAPSKDQAPQTHWTNRYTHMPASCSIPSASLPPTTHHLPSFDATPPSISSIYHIAPSVLSSVYLSVFSHLFSLSQGQRDSLGCCRLPFRIFSLFLSSP